MTEESYYYYIWLFGYSVCQMRRKGRKGKGLKEKKESKEVGFMSSYLVR